MHPDKNMGSPLASESFKKLQCAYEVSDPHISRGYQIPRKEIVGMRIDLTAGSRCQ